MSRPAWLYSQGIISDHHTFIYVSCKKMFKQSSSIQSHYSLINAMIKSDNLFVGDILAWCTSSCDCGDGTPLDSILAPAEGTPLDSIVGLAVGTPTVTSLVGPAQDTPVDSLVGPAVGTPVGCTAVDSARGCVQIGSKSSISICEYWWQQRQHKIEI